MSLVQRYRKAAAAVEAEAGDDWSSDAFDAAVELELEAENALRVFVKLATSQNLDRPVGQPVAAYFGKTLVIVARDPDDSWNELLLVIDPEHIARGE
jgi:hypothetical protein